MDLDSHLDGCYPGDRAWEDYVSAFQNDWLKLKNKHFFLDVTGDEGFAIVLSYILENNIVRWFEKSIPALGGHSPREVLNKCDNGKNVLRALIMKMPV